MECRCSRPAYAIIAVRQEHINIMIEQGMITEAQAAQHLDQMFRGYGRWYAQSSFENCPFFETVFQEQ